MKKATFAQWLADIFETDASEVETLLGDKTASQFLIAWSLLESKCLSGFVKAEDIQSFAKGLPTGETLATSSIREHAQYFHCRYQDQTLFMNLVRDDKLPARRGSPNKLRKDVDHIVTMAFDQLNAVQTIVFCTFVVYKFRNNIFHGNKGVRSWLNFSAQIDRCTLVMQELISLRRDDSMPAQRRVNHSR